MEFHDIKRDKPLFYGSSTILVFFLPCDEIKGTMAKKKINVQGQEIRIAADKNGEYVCITDMTQKLEGKPEDYVRNWIRTATTVDFLAAWEKVHNKSFNLVGFHQIKINLSRGDFLMSIKRWVKDTSAIGIYAKAGRYGGTYAHSDIALQFATWLSPEFYVYLIKEFKALKAAEAKKLNKPWNVNRYLSKINYSIHTEAVRESLPLMIQRTKKESGYFASEADMLNEIVFGMTAKQWRTDKPKLSGNIRDHATHDQLHVLANLEVLNAKLLELAFNLEERRIQLRETAQKHRSIISDRKRLEP